MGLWRSWIGVHLEWLPPSLLRPWLVSKMVTRSWPHIFVGLCDMKKVISPGKWDAWEETQAPGKHKTISLSLPQVSWARGRFWLGISKSQAPVTPVRLDGLTFTALKSCCAAPEIPGDDKVQIYPHLPTRTEWAANLTAPWEAEALSKTLPQNLSQLPITRVSCRVNQVLPESSPVKMQTPGPHPKLNLWS